MGIILWELLRRQTLANYLGLREELEIREIVCKGHPSAQSLEIVGKEKFQDFSGGDSPRDPFWPRALALITEESSTLSSEGKNFLHVIKNRNPLNSLLAGNKTGWASQLGQIKECIADCLRFEPDARSVTSSS